MQRDPEKQEPTTFGAIIERPQHSPEPPPPPRLHRLSASKDKTATTVPSTSTRASPELSTANSIRPHLHLAAAAQIIDPPLPSPYSISEEQHVAHNIDLEAAIPSSTATTPAAAALAPHAPTPTTVVTAPAPVSPGAQRVSVPDTIAAASTVVAGGGGGLHTPQRLGSTRSTASTGSATSSTAPTAVAVAEKTTVVTTGGGDSLRPAGTSAGQECTMWPSASELHARHKREKRARSRNPLRKLSRRNRVIISVVIALTVVSAAVGIGVGISRAYHGEVWAGNGKSMPIPGS